MNSTWKSVAMLAVLGLGGCRTIDQSPSALDHGPVLKQSRLLNQSEDDSKTADTGRFVQPVAFQQDVSEVDQSASGPLEIQSMRENGDQAPGDSDDGLTDNGLTLTELEQLAIGNNPALAAANLAVAKSTGLLHQVGVRPNPTIGYTGNQIADQGTDQHAIFVEQEFVRGNKLALNREVLRHTTEAQRWEIETQRYRVLTDVRIRFYEAAAAQKQLAETSRFAKIAQRGLEIATDLQEAGEGTLIDVLQSRTLLSEINLAFEQSQASFLGAWSDLVAIAGTPDLQPTQLSADFNVSETNSDWDSTFRKITAESPELAVANAIVCEKRAYLERQRAQTIPNVTGQIAAGYDRTTDSGMINLQFGVPIPIQNKNCGNISAAHADYVRAVENVRRIELSIKSRLARAAQEFESANVLVQKYEQEILPQVNQSLEISERAYSAGELAFLQVLVVRRSYYDSNIRFIQAQGKLAQASAAVEGLLLTGGLNVPRDYTVDAGLRDQSLDGR